MTTTQTKAKKKRGPRAMKAQAALKKMRDGLDRALLRALKEGLPVVGPDGKYLLGDDGQPIMRPCPAAFLTAGLRRVQQLAGEAQEERAREAQEARAREMAEWAREVGSTPSRHIESLPPPVLENPPESPELQEARAQLRRAEARLKGSESEEDE